MEKFINKSNSIHNNKYDYTNVIYINGKTKVKIMCKTHGEFEQTPIRHYKSGCQKCKSKRIYKHTTETFIQKSKDIHNNKYDYSNVNYIDNKTKVKIICKIHGEFELRPDDHFQKVGCANCSTKNINNNKIKFLEQANDVHQKLYDYSKVNYIKNSINIKIICKIHGEFEQLPLNHLKGNGCYRCSGFNRNTEDFINKAKEVHGDIYDYSKINYENTRKSVIIICKIHGEFEQIPNYHLSGCGCTKCQFYSHSKVCLRWLNQIEKNLGYKICHMNNEGEMKIKVNNKLIKFDGFDPKTNTVYEFHGSMWHGDPRVYKSTDINPVNKKLYGDLYSDTLKREELIKKLGYNLIIMWEKDFK